MALIISSKNIFDIDNPKVISNQIDKIESSVVDVVLDNKYNEAVSNNDIYEGFKKEGDPIPDKDVKLLNTLGKVIYFIGAYIYADNQYYISKTINIPIQYDIAHIVDSILLGLNKDGETNIKYSCSGEVNIGTTNAAIVVSVITNGMALESWSSGALPPSEFYPTEKTSAAFNIPTDDNVSYTNNDAIDTVVTAEIDIPTKDNLGTVTASKVTIDGQDYLQLDLQNILCGIRITKLAARGNAFPLPSNSNSYMGSFQGGVYTEYIPKRVSISVYGNTIGIDLKDNTVTIGNGKQTYSFTGNELLQTGSDIETDIGLTKYNTDNVFSYDIIAYKGIKVKVGDKIRYSNQDLQVATVNEDKITFTNTEFGNDLEVDSTIVAEYFADAIDIRYNKVIDEWRNGKEVATIRCGITDYYDENDNLVVSPYGKKSNVRISLGDDLFSKDDYIDYEISTTSGLNVGDILEYKGERTTYSYDGDYYYVRVLKNGAFAQKAGQGYFTAQKVEELPMTINIGDTVIPYVFGANGKDKPMSLYSNGNPKKFNVVGKRLISDGGVWQTLTLQEI